MKKTLKTFARALSPFNAKLHEKHNEKNAEDYCWNLKNTNLEQVLVDFYSIHNPERIQNVKTIIGEYQGEEIKMLQQLCARYNISEANMQVYIDNAKINSNVNNTYQNRNLSSDTKTFSNKNNNVEHRKIDNSYEIYSDYSWNLSGVDIATALQLIYKKHNPTKVPNVASLSAKSNSELTLILQQLCKRHSLDHSEIQDYLDRSVMKLQQKAIPTSDYKPSKSVSFPKTVDVEQQDSILERNSQIDGNKTTNDIQRATTLQSLSSSGSIITPRAVTSIPPPPPPPPPAATTTVAHNNETNSHKPPKPPSSITSTATSSSVVVGHGSNSSSTKSTSVTTKNKAAAKNKEKDSSVTAEVTSEEEEKTTSNVLAAKLKLQQSKLQQADNITVEIQAKYETLLELYKQKEIEHGIDISTQNTLLKSREERNSQLENELKDMKHILLNTEKRREDILKEHNILKDDYKYLESKLNEIETKCNNALLDRKDLLRLIDIMSSSPVAIKTVLEAYLSKLGETTGSSAVKHGIGSDGQQLPISHRISIALSIKRGCLDPHSDLVLSNNTTLTDTVNSNNYSSSNNNNNNNTKVISDYEAINHGLSEQERHTYDTFKSNIKKKSRDYSPAVDDKYPNHLNTGGITSNSNNMGIIATSPLMDNHKLMTEQYDLAKKYYKQQEQQEKLAQKIHASNLNIKEMQTNMMIGNSVSKDEVNMVLASNDGDIATDWIECTDPRTKRKYYYSATLKKSSWTKPYNFNNIELVNKPSSKLINITTPPNNNNNNNNNNHRYESPNHGFRTTAEVYNHTTNNTTDIMSEMNNHTKQKYFNTNSNNTPFKLEELSTTTLPIETSDSAMIARSDTPSSIRTTEEYNSMFFATRAASSGTSLVHSKWNRSGTASPAASITSSHRSASPANSYNSTTTSRNKNNQLRSNSNSNNDKSSVWVVAIDPHSKRKYWYNRQTKVSTWRQPVELLM